MKIKVLKRLKVMRTVHITNQVLYGMTTLKKRKSEQGKIESILRKCLKAFQKDCN